MGGQRLDPRWCAREGRTGTRCSVLDLGRLLLVTVVPLVCLHLSFEVRNAWMDAIRRDATYTEFAMSSAAFVTRRLAVFATFWISFGMMTAGSRFTGLSEVVVVEIVVVRRL